MRHTISAPQTWNSKDWLEGMDRAADGNTHLSLHGRSHHTGYCLLGGNDATASAWSHRRTKAQGDEVIFQKETKKITPTAITYSMCQRNGIVTLNASETRNALLMNI